MNYTISFVNAPPRTVVLPNGYFISKDQLMYDGPLSPDDFCIILNAIAECKSRIPSIMVDFFDKYSPMSTDFIVGDGIRFRDSDVVDAVINLPAFIETMAACDPFTGDKSLYGLLAPKDIFDRATKPEFIQQVLMIITTPADDEMMYTHYLARLKDHLLKNSHEDMIEYIEEAIASRRMN